MRVLISNEGDHEPKGTYMVVDSHGLMVDLSKIAGQLLDRSVTRITWEPQIVNGESTEGGAIYRQDGGRQVFWDRDLLKPYLDAYQARKVELLAQSQPPFEAGPAQG